MWYAADKIVTKKTWFALSNLSSEMLSAGGVMGADPGGDSGTFGSNM